MGIVLFSAVDFGVWILLILIINRKITRGKAFPWLISSILLVLSIAIRFMLWNYFYPGSVFQLPTEWVFLLNPVFISGLLVSFLLWRFHKQLVSRLGLDSPHGLLEIVPLLLIGTVLLLGNFEIRNFWYQTAWSGYVFKNFAIMEPDLDRLSDTWTFIYSASILFFAGLSFKMGKIRPGLWIWLAILIAFLFFVFSVTEDLSKLRYTYMNAYEPNIHIIIRYAAYVILVFLVVIFHKISQKLDATYRWALPVSIGVLLILSWVVSSSELTNIMVLSNFDSAGVFIAISNKWPYTILWVVISMASFILWKYTSGKVYKWFGIIVLILVFVKILTYDLDVFGLTM